MLNMPIQNYLSVNVSKDIIEQYKDQYVSIQSIQTKNSTREEDIYENIFAKTFKSYDLRNAGVYESLYFLNFISQNCMNIYEEDWSSIIVHPSWKDH